MSRHQRLNAILTLLSERGQLSVEDGVQDLGVSAATVRRDFDHLAQQQLLTRTHGGAVSTSTSYDLPLRYTAFSANFRRLMATSCARTGWRRRRTTVGRSSSSTSFPGPRIARYSSFRNRSIVKPRSVSTGSSRIRRPNATRSR